MNRLPSIINIAEKYKLEFDKKTYGRKETRTKCPFCHADSNRPDKYYMSLNTKDNVFKCWYCEESGGVLKFEALISDKSHDEVRSKYFGERRKNVHPAYSLTPDQLRRIGWQDKKRDDFGQFVQSKEQVLKEWELFKYEELAKYHALFLLMANYHKDKQKENYISFLEMVKSSEIDGLKEIIEDEYKNPSERNWAVSGREIAQLAHQLSVESGDIELTNIFINVIFAIELKKSMKRDKQTKVSV